MVAIRKSLGEFLTRKRMEQGISLHEMCTRTNFDSTWYTKVELDEKCPVSEKNFIKLVSGALSISEGSKDYAILESLIIKSEKTATNPKERPIEKRLPAFFRNPKGGKPTKEDLIGILDLIEDS